MPLLIDTYNVLHTTGVLPPELAGLDVDGFAYLVGSSRYKRRKAVFVCDGQSNRRHEMPFPTQTKIIYSGTRRSADEVINDLIEKSSAPRRLIVVSSDRQVKQSARRRRARSITSEVFLAHLTADISVRHQHNKNSKPTQNKVSKKQVKEWIKTFGLDHEMQTLPSATGSSATKKQKKKRVSKRRRHKHSDLPQNVIDEAERLWQQHNQG